MRRIFNICATLISCFAVSSAADYATAGALASKGNWEVSIVFDKSVNRASAFAPANYVLSSGTIDDLRDGPLDNAIILTVSGLATNVPYSVTITNVLSTNGATLPSLSLPFTTKPMSWAAIGVQELALTPEALAIGNDGFDLVSGAVQMYGTYDESTFAYEVITGNFDKRVRVVAQEGSSPEARAGLMVREVLDERKSRPLDPTNPDEAFSRYLQIHINPTNTAFVDFEGTPVPARNQYQINFRPYPSGPTENPEVDTNAPAYPNAWLRLKRVGQTFHVFRGNDGTNWVRLGTFTFSTTDPEGNTWPAFSQTAFVGPNYSPEVGNIPASSGARRAFLAQFRDYSNAFGDVEIEEPQLSLVQSGNQISWTAGTLQGTTNIAANAWTDISQSSPYKFTPDKRYQFFRARNP